MKDDFLLMRFSSPSTSTLHATRSTARAVAAIALTLAVFAGTASPASAAAGFGDVEPNSWYTDAIAWMVDEGITTGTEPGCFSPTEQVTRGQVVTFLFRIDAALGNNPGSSGHPFTDIWASYQHEPVGWAYDSGITTGRSATTFSPDEPIARGDFAVMLWRYAGRPDGAPAHPFLDVTREYREQPIAWMFDEGITTGKSATAFDPWGVMTRAEAATFLHRFMGTPEVTSATLAAGGSCLRALRDVLVDSGLTAAEAACAAPHMADIEPTTIRAVANDEQSATGSMISTISTVLTAGCIPISRWSALTRIFL